MKKILLPTLAAVVILVIAVWSLAANKHSSTAKPANPSTNLSATGLVFYYGDGCPHCANVEKYFADNQVESKITFDKKEVYNNQTNQDELLTRATACGLSRNSIGVPLLWHDGQCLEGDTNIINFFDQELKK